MRYFPHPVVLEQVSAPQPSIFLIVFLFVAPGWLLTIITQLVMLWPPFLRWTSDYPSHYIFGFFFVQLSLICFAIAFFSIRYSSALWKPAIGRRLRAFLIALLIFIPLLLYQLASSAQGIRTVLLLSGYPDHAPAEGAFVQIHDEVWGQLAYGTSLAGVICSSLFSLVGPLHEEMIISGLIANTFAKRYGIATATVATPICFALFHVPQFGVGWHLAPLLLAGATYTLIRFLSGGLYWAVAAHVFINAIVFLPRWLVAFIHFRID